MRPLRVFVLGGRGFLGSAFMRVLAREGHLAEAIGRNDHAAFRGRECDLLVNANGNSKKFLAAQDPALDFQLSVASVLEALQAYRYGAYLHVSSVDVYPVVDDPARNHEDVAIDPALPSVYGYHKLVAEGLVRRYAHDWTILRMGGVLGQGLKKNPVFDLLTGQPLRVHPDSRFQYLDTEDVARIGLDLHGRGIRGEVFNACGTGTVSIAEVAALAGVQVPAAPEGARKEHYEVSNRKLAGYFPVPETRDAVETFLRAPRLA